MTRKDFVHPPRGCRARQCSQPVGCNSPPSGDVRARALTGVDLHVLHADDTIVRWTCVAPARRRPIDLHGVLRSPDRRWTSARPGGRFVSAPAARGVHALGWTAAVGGRCRRTGRRGRSAAPLRLLAAAARRRLERRVLLLERTSASASPGRLCAGSRATGTGRARAVEGDPTRHGRTSAIRRETGTDAPAGRSVGPHGSDRWWHVVPRRRAWPGRRLDQRRTPPLRGGLAAPVTLGGPELRPARPPRRSPRPPP